MATEKPILYDFWASWCGPCKALAPTLEKIVEARGSEFVFTKVNADEDFDLATKFKIQSLPTLLLVKNDNEIARLTGLNSENTINEFLDSHLKD